MERRLSLVFLGVGVFAIVLTIGFFAQIGAITGLWMWPDGRLTYIFIASITAAIALPAVWIGLSQDWAAALGGGVNLALQAAGISLFLAQMSLSGGQTYWPHVVVFGIFTLVNLGLVVWARRFALKDSRSTPMLVRLSFAVFTGVLLLVSVSLLLKTPNIFPWPLKPETSVMIGWVFFGTTFYFAYGVWRARWSNAVGQLLGFLAYDLVLIVPFIGHFSSVLPEQRLSLIIYAGVLIYSGALAIYFLFIHPTWRLRRPSPI